MGLDGRAGPGPVGWMDIARTAGHTDSSHLAGHTGSALQPLQNTPEMSLFTSKAPSETSRVRPFPCAPVILVSICPSPIRVRVCPSVLPQSPLPGGRGEVQGPNLTPPSGTWGSLWGVPGQAPNTHFHPGAPATPFCPGFTPKQAPFCPPPSAQGAG